MLAIVSGHLFGEGRVTAHVPPQAWLPSLLLGNGARLAVGIFAILGCWFLADVPEFTLGRWLRIHATVLSYTIPLTILTALVWGGVGPGEFIRACLPVLGRPLWFASAWLILLAISPALHAASFSASRRHLGLAAATLLAAITVPATFAGTIANDFFASILWFVFLYLFTSWLKRRDSRPLDGIPRFAALAAGIALYAIPVLVEWAVLRSGGATQMPPAPYRIASMVLADFKSLPMFISAFCIFVFFAKTDIGSRKWINLAARPAFAVYVAHQTPAFFPHLWADIIRCQDWYCRPDAPLVAVGFTLAIYSAVALAETARLHLLRRMH